MNQPEPPKMQGRPGEGQAESAHLTIPHVRFSVVFQQGSEAGEEKAVQGRQLSQLRGRREAGT